MTAYSSASQLPREQVVPYDPAPAGRNRYFPGLMVFRDMPQPLASGEYSQFFYSRWGRDAAVISARSRLAEYPAHPQSPSIKCSFAGTESYFLGPRTINVDESTYLLLNASEYGSRIASCETVHSFVVFFAPDMVQQVSSALTRGAGAALDGGGLHSQPMRFAEHLRLHETGIGAQLRELAAATHCGDYDADWVLERVQMLLQSLLLKEGANQALAAHAPPSRKAQRDELQRRVRVARDYIHSNFQAPLTVDQIAREAALSPYHLIDQFKNVVGETPHRYLNRCRLARAVFLLRTTDLTMTEAAIASGFENRTTLHRNCRTILGHTPAQAAERGIQVWAA